MHHTDFAYPIIRISPNYVYRITGDRDISTAQSIIIYAWRSPSLFFHHSSSRAHDSSLFYHEVRRLYLIFFYFPSSSLYVRSIEATSPLYPLRPLKIRIKYPEMRFNSVNARPLISEKSHTSATGNLLDPIGSNVAIPRFFYAPTGRGSPGNPRVFGYISVARSHLVYYNLAKSPMLFSF